MKRYKSLYNILMYLLVGVVTSYLYYRLMVLINVQNDYHLNKDIWIFNIFAGIVGAMLKSAYVEWNRKDTTIEDEIRHYMMDETNKLISEMEKNKKEEINNFKFFR